MTASAIHIRQARSGADVQRAATLDAAVTGSKRRTAYIGAVAQKGGLSVALQGHTVRAFSCLDENYFFEKRFVSLLIVDPAARRQGLGAALLAFSCRGGDEVWTSTNRSNTPMRALLAKARWTFCGELEGLDEGDPELFFKAPPSDAAG